jgi:hypothetical protein
MSLTIKFLPSAFLMAALCGCSATPRAESQEPLATQVEASALFGTWTGTCSASDFLDVELTVITRAP